MSSRSLFLLRPSRWVPCSHVWSVKIATMMQCHRKSHQPLAKRWGSHQPERDPPVADHLAFSASDQGRWLKCDWPRRTKKRCGSTNRVVSVAWGCGRTGAMLQPRLDPEEDLA